jgi:hypothetical protein
VRVGRASTSERALTVLVRCEYCVVRLGTVLVVLYPSLYKRVRYVVSLYACIPVWRGTSRADVRPCGSAAVRQCVWRCGGAAAGDAETTTTASLRPTKITSN